MKLNKLTKTEKTSKKEDNTNESDSSENEILDLNSLKHFNFEPKTTSEMLTVVVVMMRKVLSIK